MDPRPAFVNGSTPTVLLVHGAFTDASSWAGVITGLQGSGVEVAAVANPLRGIADDAAYLTSVAAAIDGPLVLVGHAYGGAVITESGARPGNVVGLVYVAAYAPAEGERLLDLTTTFLGPVLRPVGAELYLTTAGHCELFGSDDGWPAVAQRPIAATAFEEPVTTAAWRTLPSWFVVANGDRAIHPDTQRFMARRADADTVEVDACHAVARARPDEVVAHIRGAVTALSRRHR
ncbi:alpha/beta hydrolase [Lentzea tibetensis]|uniref:Alpha/beta hydrolase n=1 Tax=Lentzea tibetensis TaxID=2591470 RepID=A0A563F2H2_9PSEU|nr:alpha/beta hydrolase [Lentzea tibetensis]TWP53938.1 alpha/beta hydrolase [Lentzea tibetensis]